MPSLKYGEDEIAYLSRKDKKLGALINKIGFIECEIQANLFDSLVCSIATQQISNKAAETVRRRIADKFGVITPESIAAVTDNEIQTVGISMRKVNYIRGLCEEALSGNLDIEGLRLLSNEEVTAKLIPIKGIGSWTIEMFLIFSLERMNVLSYGDYAIRKGIMLLYGLKELDKVKFDRYRNRYSPFGTIASLYLWALSEGK